VAEKDEINFDDSETMLSGILCTLSGSAQEAKVAVHCQIVETRTSASPPPPSARLSISARDSKNIKIGDQQFIRCCRTAVGKLTVRPNPVTEGYLCQK
jgi:hypothetical protein